MNKVVTLLGFLEATGAQVKIFDIGRRLGKISRDDFEKIENQQIPYPYPLQQQAWLGMSILDKQVSDEPVIWFLRFPLDETGNLQLASRDYFIHRLFEAATARQSANDTELSADALKDNPHVFKPRDDKMAVFHARLARKLHQPPSRFYQHTREYLTGAKGWEQWSFLGFQGIADVAERIEDQDNKALLITALPHLPAQPLEAFCQCLENQPLSIGLTSALQQRLNDELAKGEVDASLVAHLVRAVSLSRSTSIHNDMINQAMVADKTVQEAVLPAIAARSWEWLETPANAERFLASLARMPADTFNGCLTDLLFMPKLRERLLAVIRSPERPDRLAEAFNNLVKTFAN
jgi:hypothetical protein